MKDSIQKIIDKLKDKDWYNPKDTTRTEWIELTWEETNLLLDYITNLEQENKRLKENIRKDEVYFKTFELAEECDQKQDIIDIYKSRIDKAIEYIIENRHLSMFNDGKKPEEDWNYVLEIDPRELLDILKGSDK